MPDLLILQCVAERVFPPANHAGRAEKWRTSGIDATGTFRLRDRMMEFPRLACRG
jgi:hypothetical protein